MLRALAQHRRMGFQYKREEEIEERRNKFLDIKLRVSHDVQKGYEGEKTDAQNIVDKAQATIKALEDEMPKLQGKADEMKGQADTCLGEQKSVKDQLATAEAELSKLKGETDKEAASWKTELETLNQQMAAQSAACKYLKKGSQEGSKLCGIEVKAEAPKQEEPKAEAPKKEEPKAEAPKKEEPKAEAPKQEEPKPEAPKQ
uniref:FK506-binding protein 3 isoform X2 n=1 Tax=Monopterus albus TaxID=43700 RepID=UPI0009B4E584|nr:FK506-binding protein 3-like isoform X2 [Monopterus albus]